MPCRRPWFSGKLTTCAPPARATAAVSSVDPSSITSRSASGSSRPASSSSAGSDAASFQAGMNTTVSRIREAWRTLVPHVTEGEGSMRVRVLLAAIAVAAVLAGTAEAAPRYTALGDSFAAGPLIPLPLSPLGCLKSSNNYGRIAQRTLLYPEYRDATCSGARTNHMFVAQKVSPGPNPPQLDSLS